MVKTLNLQRIELRLPFGLGQAFAPDSKKRIYYVGRQKVVGILNFIKNPPLKVYSYLLFVYSDMPGKDLQQYLEIKLTRSTGASVIKKPFIQYIRAGSRGRCLYLRVPVASVNKIDELVNMIMIEANTSYLTVCEPITETR